MARTRGASNVIHSDDGELLDKEGKPMPVVAHHHATPEAVVVDDTAGLTADDFKEDGTLKQEGAPVVVQEHYHCDITTVQRDCDGWELIRLLEVLIGRAVTADISPEEFGVLSADVKRHFRRVV